MSKPGISASSADTASPPGSCDPTRDSTVPEEEAPPAYQPRREWLRSHPWSRRPDVVESACYRAERLEDGRWTCARLAAHGWSATILAKLRSETEARRFVAYLTASDHLMREALVLLDEGDADTYAGLLALALAYARGRDS